MDTCFALQKPDGMLPYHGLAAGDEVSFTYHLHNLIAIYNVFIYDGDVDWLKGKWDAWKLGIQWSLGNVDEEVGLMMVTSDIDWARAGLSGFNIAVSISFNPFLH